MTTIIDTLDQEQIDKLTAPRSPDFEPGDTLRVNVKVIEGTRERVQAFEGVCIAPQERRRELLASRCARSPTARASSACSRSTARASAGDRGGAPRRRAPRQALLPARPARQGEPHRRGRRGPARADRRAGRGAAKRPRREKLKKEKPKARAVRAAKGGGKK